MHQPITSHLTTHPDWRAFLAAAGATFENDRVQHFGHPDTERLAAQSGNILVDLSHLSLLRAEGEDAQTFLQGQLSNDIRQVSESSAQLSAYCNPKGRMLAIFQIFRRGDAYYLQLPAQLAEATLKRLRMFVLRAKVKLDCVDTELARIGLSGPLAETLVRENFGNAPVSVYDCLSVDDVTIVRLPGLHARFEFFAQPARLKQAWTAFATKSIPAGSGCWAWLDIQAGIPTVLPGTVEEFVPQMANLELVGGVSFTKGCYPGQEIVARMHYLGRLKQRMFRAHVESALPPQPGTPVFAPDLPGQSTGSVLDAQPAPEGGYDLLAVVHLSSREAGELHLQASDGPHLILENLPYPLTPTGNAQ
jgi:folate-binding protein YgfZ